MQPHFSIVLKKTDTSISIQNIFSLMSLAAAENNFHYEILSEHREDDFFQISLNISNDSGSAITEIFCQKIESYSEEDWEELGAIKDELKRHDVSVSFDFFTNTNPELFPCFHKIIEAMLGKWDGSVWYQEQNEISKIYSIEIFKSAFGIVSLKGKLLFSLVAFVFIIFVFACIYGLIKLIKFIF